MVKQVASKASHPNAQEQDGLQRSLWPLRALGRYANESCLCEVCTWTDTGALKALSRRGWKQAGSSRGFNRGAESGLLASPTSTILALLPASEFPCDLSCSTSPGMKLVSASQCSCGAVIFGAVLSSAPAIEQSTYMPCKAPPSLQVHRPRHPQLHDIEWCGRETYSSAA